MKYPRMLRIPLEKEQIDSKRYATDADIKELLSCEVVIDEKLDDSAVSFSKEGNDIVAYGKRNEIMRNGVLSNRIKPYIMLDKWYWEYIENLQRIPDGYTLFGAWMYVKHTIYYDKLPDYWLYFDVHDGKRFVPDGERREITDKINLWGVPILRVGHFNKLSLKGLSYKKASNFGDRAEGFVVKNYEKQIFMKFVRHEFDVDLEESEHWLKQPLEVNRLRTEVE